MDDNSCDYDEDLQNNNSLLQETTVSSQKKIIQYRRLLNQIEDVQEKNDINLQTVVDIRDIIKHANNLQISSDNNNKPINAEETILDSMVLSSSGEILLEYCKSLDAFDLSYSSQSFAEKILKKIKRPENLLNLTQLSTSIIPKVPKYTYIYGSYDKNAIVIEPNEKQKVPRKRPPKEDLQKKQPEKIIKLSKEEESIEEIVKFLYSVLEKEYKNNGQEPINYYDYIIDTDSFFDTVQNMFHFAFLIKDGLASIDLDKRCEPIIKPMKKSKNVNEENATTSQMIATISFPEWKKFKNEGMLQKYKKRLQK